MRPTVVRVPPYSVMADAPGGPPATHVHHCSVETILYQICLASPSSKYWRHVTDNPSDIQMSHKSISFRSTTSPFVHLCQVEASNGIRRHLDSCIRVLPPLPALPWARLTRQQPWAGRDAMISGYTHLSNEYTNIRISQTDNSVRRCNQTPLLIKQMPMGANQLL